MKESRSELNFKKDDQLSAHKIPYDERIGDSVRIGDIARLGTVVIKYTGRRANLEDAETSKKRGLASIPGEQDENSKDTRHRSNLTQSGAGGGNNTTKAYQDEIKSLNSKFQKSEIGLEGFVYKIVPEDYSHGYKETRRILKFFLENEYKEKRSKIRVITSWSKWQPQKELPCWGVRIDNSVGKDNPSEHELHRNKNQGTSDITTVIVSETRFYQVREFRVIVTINGKAVKEAKDILKMRTRKAKQNAVKKFNDKYCSFVYSGKFCAGAWLWKAVTATPSKRSKAVASTNLEKCALEDLDHRWSQEIQGNRSSSCSSVKNKDVNVRKLTDTSDPPKIQNMPELEGKIKDVHDCTVFPANCDGKSHFTPVYKIMQNQAKENNDEDLRKVCDIFKEYMKGKIFFGSLQTAVNILPPPLPLVLCSYHLVHSISSAMYYRMNLGRPVIVDFNKRFNVIFRTSFNRPCLMPPKDAPLRCTPRGTT